jgi:YidC/Oxa1 family membrane protein insertase
MEKLKLLNLFILAFLLSLLVQYFFVPTKQTEALPVGAILSVKKESVVIPNIPVVSLKNTSTGTISINPCQEVTITVNSLPLVGMSGLAPAFCRNLSVASGMTKDIPLKELYPIFAKQDGKYLLTLKTQFGERMVAFSVEKPGLIRNTLSFIVYQPIYNLFVALLTFLPEHSLGWAIIILTIIIRFILLVPQNHMLEWQKKMQKIQPKIKALQKEYKDDQATLGMKMLELYKAEWVNPMGSIAPMFIQMPILIGLYWVISEINDPSNFYHLYSIFASFRPTEISTLFYGLDLSVVGGIFGIWAGVVLAIVQYIQARMSVTYTEKKSKDTKEVQKHEDMTEMALDPAMMQNMMLYFFPLMIGVTAYFFPLGVALYWFMGTLFVIAQQAFVNRKK